MKTPIKSKNKATGKQPLLVKPVVSLSVCTCENPRVERCVLSGVLFCMKCLSPMQTGS